jgi:hypothetical protein
MITLETDKVKIPLKSWILLIVKIATVLPVLYEGLVASYKKIKADIDGVF